MVMVVVEAAIKRQRDSNECLLQELAILHRRIAIWIAMEIVMTIAIQIQILQQKEKKRWSVRNWAKKRWKRITISAILAISVPLHRLLVSTCQGCPWKKEKGMQTGIRMLVAIPTLVLQQQIPTIHLPHRPNVYHPCNPCRNGLIRLRDLVDHPCHPQCLTPRPHQRQPHPHRQSRQGCIHSGGLPLLPFHHLA